MAHEFKSDVLLPAATTSVPSLNVPHGTAPTTPSDGDIWTTTSGIYARINGTTNQLDASGGAHDHDSDYLALSGGTLTGDLVTQQATSNAYIGADSGSGYTKAFVMRNTTDRWSFQSTNEVESGSDAGSNFAILAFNDSGSYIDSPMKIMRAADGLMHLYRDTRLNGSDLHIDRDDTAGAEAHFIDLTTTDRVSWRIRQWTGENGLSFVGSTSTNKATDWTSTPIKMYNDGTMRFSGGSPGTNKILYDSNGTGRTAWKTAYELDLLEHDAVIIDTDADYRWFGSDITLGTNVGTSTGGHNDTLFGIVGGTNVTTVDGVKLTHDTTTRAQLTFQPPGWTDAVAEFDFRYRYYDISKTIFEWSNTSGTKIAEIRLVGGAGNYGAVRLYDKDNTQKAESAVVMSQWGKWHTITTRLTNVSTTQCNINVYIDGTEVITNQTCDYPVTSDTIGRARFGAIAHNAGDAFTVYMRNFKLKQGTTLPTTERVIAREYNDKIYAFNADDFPVSIDNSTESISGLIIDRTDTSDAGSEDIFSVQYQGTRQTWTNEYGNLRCSNTADPTQEAFKIVVDNSASGNGFRVANESDSTFFRVSGSTGKTYIQASTASTGSLNIAHGTAPSSPTNGDIWTTTAGVYARINGATVGPFVDGSGHLALDGGTLTGELTLDDSTTSNASLNMPHGVAPTTPSNGDMWTTTAGLFIRVNGNSFQSGMHIGTSAPSSPVSGMLWLDTT